MTRRLRGTHFLWLSLLGSGCGQMDGRAAVTPASEDASVRPAAVAGLFYPGDRDELSKQVNKLLADARLEPLGKLRGLVCPHAGYDFSGPTAARAYKQLAGRQIDTVVLLGPSHYADFTGIAIPDVAGFSTPLGKVPLSPRAGRLAKKPPFCNPPADCEVQRPRWWRQASLEVPPFGQDTPHTWEHSLEVQLPFLQTVLKDFRVVPAVFGRVDPAAAAQALAEVVDERTVIVASSDLSHYYSQEQAESLDASCVRAICDLDVPWMADEEACGKQPILTLMHLARQKGWKTKLLDYRTSGDTTGDRSAVVGYTAIAFFEGPGSGEQQSPAGAELTAGERQRLLAIARETVTRVVREPQAKPSAISDVPERLQQTAGCFVTLTKGGQLRGCIGHVFACMPLYQSVIVNATRAALTDPRFPPVEPNELNEIRIEISVLTRPRPLAFDSPEDLLKKLRPGVDGVMLNLHGRRATYLPQVWEQVPDKEQFVAQLAKKAGLPSRAWRDPDAAFLTYQAAAFHEAEK